MEDNLNFVVNGRQPFFCKWKTTSNLFVNGRQSQFVRKRCGVGQLACLRQSLDTRLHCTVHSLQDLQPLGHQHVREGPVYGQHPLRVIQFPLFDYYPCNSS